MRNFFGNLLASCFVLALTNLASAQDWIKTEMAPMPEPVSNNAVCEGYQNGIPFVYSFAGIDSTRNHEGIHLKSWRYNTLGNQWETLPDLPDTAGKIAAAASRIGDIIYIVGGYHVSANGNEYTSSKVHRLNTTTNSYLSNAADVPVPVDDHVQVVWRDSLLILVTGWSGNGPNGTNVPDVQIYTPETDTWAAGTPVPDNNNYKSFGASGVVIGDTIFYYGGAKYGINFPASASFVKGVINPDDPTDIDWSFLVPDQGIKGYRMAAIQRFGFAYWLGGSEITYNYDGLAYSNNSPVPPANRQYAYNSWNIAWDTVSFALPMDLRGIARTNGSTAYIAGGMIDGPHVTNQTWKLEWINITGTEHRIQGAAAVQVFPQPATEYVFIAHKNLGQNPVQIFNSMGQLIHHTVPANGKIKLNVCNWQPGVYNARTTINSTPLAIQFIVN